MIGATYDFALSLAEQAIQVCNHLEEFCFALGSFPIPLITFSVRTQPHLDRFLSPRSLQQLLARSPPFANKMESPFPQHLVLVVRRDDVGPLLRVVKICRRLLLRGGDATPV